MPLWINLLMLLVLVRLVQSQFIYWLLRPLTVSSDLKSQDKNTDILEWTSECFLRMFTGFSPLLSSRISCRSTTKVYVTEKNALETKHWWHQRDTGGQRACTSVCHHQSNTFFLKRGPRQEPVGSDQDRRRLTVIAIVFISRSAGEWEEEYCCLKHNSTCLLPGLSVVNYKNVSQAHSRDSLTINSLTHTLWPEILFCRSTFPDESRSE